MRDEEKDLKDDESDADTVPAAPSDNDDTAMGDTDQHSDADA